MEPLLRVVVNRPTSFGKQIEIIQVQQQAPFFNLVTESGTVFVSPRFVGRMRCGSRFIESKSSAPVAAYLGKGFPLVIESDSTVPWWIVHIHEDAPAHVIEQPTFEKQSFYRLHSGDDFLAANLIEKMVRSGIQDSRIESLLHDLPSQSEPCDDLPATGNRRLAEKLRVRLLASEDKLADMREIATELDCHPSQLSREFSRLFGIAPYRFSFLLRLAKTRGCLRRGMNLAEVAQNFEFADQSHFTRAFRKVYQMTPNHYRGLYRGWWEVPA